MQNKYQNYEITLRGFILATVLTAVFTAANIYLGLKIGMTFATSIPAAVISMAALRLFKNSNILENNIVQTITSAAGTISSIVFVLPALVMIGVWHGFPFWQTTLVCMAGGILGVMFTIPLRRALIVDSDLPYPEGTAAAEVLKIGAYMDDKKNKNANTKEHPIKDILFGTIISGVFSLFSNGFQILSSITQYYGRFGNILSGAGFGFSFSLIGAGYLVGLDIGIALMIGTSIAWIFAVPWYSWHQLAGQVNFTDLTLSIWANKVRPIGVGVIGIAAIWAIIELVKPVIDGVRSSFKTMFKRAAGGKYTIPVHERDIPIVWVIFITALLIFPLIAVFGYFLFVNGGNLPAELTITLVILCVFLSIFIGFIVAAVSGYMAGIIGSSNSPISGIGILAVIIIAFVIGYVVHSFSDTFKLVNSNGIIALVIFVTTAVLAMASISNDNLQDLKTGQLVGATPWKQQIALIFGVIVGSLVVAPVLNQLYQAYGFAGALPNANADPTKVLAAPQAVLMNMLAHGIIDAHMQWGTVGIGVVIGLLFLCLDKIILSRRNGLRLSVLTLGIGIYLPPDINIPIFVGSLVAYFVKKYISKHKKSKDTIESRGTLFACGLIVGDSIFGIILAAIITFSGSATPLALVGNNFASIANILSALVFTSACWFFYRYVTRSR